MSNRVRNLSILGAVAALLVLALLVILPGTPLSKDTKLGLDLEGGIELVYEARPTPQVPEVTQQAIDDAIETMRKRVDSLGVAEPEIQRSGREQIAVGLPSVQNAERAKAQVGTTARLQFYDWEPNLLTDRETYAGGNALYEATAAASKEEGRAEKVDIVPGSGDTPEEADKNNNTASDRYYLFGPDQLPIGPDKQPVRTGNYDPSGSCKELLAEYQEAPGAAKEYAKDTECLTELEALGGGGPPSGSRVIKVPEGVVVIEQERSPNQPPQIKRFTVLEDDSELSGEDIKDPEANTDPNTNAPLVSMKFSDKGREAFARVTKRIAERGFNASTLQPGGDKDQFNQRFAITLDDQIVSLATIDFTELPEGIDGRDGAQIENVGTFEDANDLAESLRIGALPIDLKLISETQVSATLGKQALDQGLLAGAAGLALTIVFLLFFYRVLGMVATAALLIYALHAVRAGQADPDHAHAAGHRRPRAHPGGGGRRQHRHVRANKGGSASGQVDSGRDLGRLLQGAADDHRRERGDRRRGVHPVHARHGRRQGLCVHARYRNARVAVHGGAGHLGDPRLDGALAPAAPPERAGRGQGSQDLVLRLHGQRRAGSSRSRA